MRMNGAEEEEEEQWGEGGISGYDSMKNTKFMQNKIVKIFA